MQIRHSMTWTWCVVLTKTWLLHVVQSWHGSDGENHDHIKNTWKHGSNVMNRGRSWRSCQETWSQCRHRGMIMVMFSTWLLGLTKAANHTMHNLPCKKIQFMLRTSSEFRLILGKTWIPVRNPGFHNLVVEILGSLQYLFPQPTATKPKQSNWQKFDFHNISQ